MQLFLSMTLLLFLLITVLFLHVRRLSQLPGELIVLLIPFFDIGLHLLRLLKEAAYLALQLLDFFVLFFFIYTPDLSMGVFVAKLRNLLVFVSNCLLYTSKFRLRVRSR